MKHASSFAATILLGATLSYAAAAPLATHTVAADTTGRSYVAEGFVEAVRQSAIAAQVPARITEMRVRAGDTVKAGQVLLRLDPRAATDLLAASQAQAAAAQAQLDAARRDFERNRRLYEKQYISAAAMEQAEAQFKAAQAQAKATTAQVGVASTQSTFTTLTAPYAGVVASVSAEVGDLATPGAPVLTVYDPKELRVVAQLPESTVRSLAGTTPVRIVVAGGEGSRSMEATRMDVLPTADPSTHMRQVRLTLPAGVPGLAPGMFARASFPLTQAPTARITVPQHSVVRRPEFTAVYVVGDDGRAQLRQIRLGRASGDNVEVLAGLAAGDRIAVDPVAAASGR
ncbi:MAG: efflux RND transporter periplasmic adaptor subunit [Burkholderiales bacterium]|nr:efflux RND transporter periplasmic adaptor subunit [Burkholderiales bacterium]